MWNFSESKELDLLGRWEGSQCWRGPGRAWWRWGAALRLDRAGQTCQKVKIRNSNMFFFFWKIISTLIISNWHGERNMSVLNLIRRILSVMVPLCIIGTSFVQKEKFYYFINVKLLTKFIPAISVWLSWNNDVKKS